VYWPAFLLSAKLALPKKLFVHEYFTVNGQKMSKTLGNVIDPIELIDEYGTDALRFYFLKYFSPFADGDFSIEKFKIAYNADLANGLGNAVARVARLAENSGFEFTEDKETETIYADEIEEAFKGFRFNEVLQKLWLNHLSAIDQHINKNAPWLIKNDDAKLQSVLQEEIDMLRTLARQIAPFMPETSEKILAQLKGPKIASSKPLFPRL
jgi:methionyl-tRNA synthetase